MIVSISVWEVSKRWFKPATPLKNSWTAEEMASAFSRFAKMVAAVSKGFCCGSVEVKEGLMGLSASFFSVSALPMSFLFSFSGVAGILSWAFSSFGGGEAGRLTDGVLSAVAWVAVFLVFFLRPMMGACTGSSITAFAEVSSGLADSSACFARACLSFFCWLFVTCLAGADPTLGGGGELARDKEVDVTEALSDIFSLIGVPGGWIEEKLPQRDTCLLAAEPAVAAATDGEAAAARGGVSAFGVGTARMVRVWFWRVTDGREVADAAVAGVLGWETPDVIGRTDSFVSTDLLSPDEAATDPKSFFEASFAAAMSSFPGSWRFSIVWRDFLGLTSLSFLGWSWSGFGLDE